MRTLSKRSRRLFIATSVMAGFVLALLGWEHTASDIIASQSVVTKVGGITEISTPMGAFSYDRMLEVELSSPPAPNCTRTVQQLLYRCELEATDYGTDLGYDPEQPAAGLGPCHHKPTFYPLASSLNGNGFTAFKDVLPLGARYWLKLQLPSTIPVGKYIYVYRSIYHCSWLHGLIRQDLPFEATPRTIELH